MRISFNTAEGLKIVSGTNLNVGVASPELLFASNFRPVYTSLYTFSIASDPNIQYRYWSRPRVPTIYLGFVGSTGSLWQGHKYDYRVWGNVGSYYYFIPVTTYYVDFRIKTGELQFQIETPDKNPVTLKIWVLEDN